MAAITHGRTGVRRCAAALAGGFAALFAASLAPGQQPAGGADPLNLVDPFIGTAGDHGQLFPGAAFPFGLVKLSPDTEGRGQAGYDYNQRAFRGFSHTRLGGVGCAGTGGAVLITPVLSDRDTLHKVEEDASPGFYLVRFENGLTAELAAGPRIGHHRYTLPPDREELRLIVNLRHNLGGFVDAAWNRVDTTRLTGRVELKNVCERGSHRLFFAIDLSRLDAEVVPLDEHRVEIRCRVRNGEVAALRVALSPVDEAEAELELAADPAAADFDAALAIAEVAWRDRLGRVRIAGAAPYGEASRRLLYTALYRSMLVPQLATSSRGLYRTGPTSETVRRLEPGESPHLSGWSTWDDFRKFALLAIVVPDDCARTRFLVHP